MKLEKLQNIALYLFFFSINFEVWDPFNSNGNFSISKLTGFLYLSSLIPHLSYFLKFRGLGRIVNPLWLLFGLLTIVNILNLNSVSYSFINFSILQNIILFILLVNHGKRNPGILDKGLLCFSFGSITLAFLFYLGVGVSSDLGRIRMFGDNENEIGLRMCISIIYLTFFIIQNPFKLNKKRFLLFLFIPLLLSLMVATGSRVAFISFSLSFIFALTIVKTRKVKTKFIILGVGVIIGIFIMNYVVSSDVLYHRLINSAEKGDLSERGRIWNSLIPLIQANPFFGVGTTGYALYSTKVFGRIISPHNVIIEVWCYAGLIGVCLYFVFLFKIAKISFTKYKINGSTVQLILLIPILGSILSGQLLTSKISWILFAFQIGVMSIQHRRKKLRKTNNLADVKN